MSGIVYDLFRLLGLCFAWLGVYVILNALKNKKIPKK